MYPSKLSNHVRAQPMTVWGTTLDDGLELELETDLWN